MTIPPNLCIIKGKSRGKDGKGRQSGNSLLCTQKNKKGKQKDNSKMKQRKWVTEKGGGFVEGAQVRKEARSQRNAN